MFRSITITKRICLYVFLTFGTLVLMAGLSFLMMDRIIDSGTDLAKKELLDAQRARIKDVTHASASGLARFTAGLPEEEQLRIIADYIEKSRFEDDKSGYFYVYKGTVCAAHPVQKQLIGKDLGTTADKNGVRYVAEFDRLVPQGGGFVDFIFPKPGAGDVFKLGYAEGIPGTPFWIGTGVYIDNVDRAEERLHTSMDALLQDTLRIFSLIFAALLLIGGAPVSYMLIVSITRPLNSITRLARSVADGNLDEVITPAGKDEISLLESALRDMVATLKKHIHQAEEKSVAAEKSAKDAGVALEKANHATAEAQKKSEALLATAAKLEEVSSNMSSALSSLSSRIEQSDKHSSDAAHRLTEAATAMNEMNATVREVARNASETQRVSSETRQKAEDGEHVVENSLQCIQSVHQVSLELKDDMEKLNDHTRAIAHIMSVIRTSPIRRTCWHSTRPSRPPARAKPAGGSPSLRMRCASWRKRPWPPHRKWALPSPPFRRARPRVRHLWEKPSGRSNRPRNWRLIPGMPSRRSSPPRRPRRTRYAPSPQPARNSPRPATKSINPSPSVTR